MKAKTFRIVCFSVSAVILVIVLALNIAVGVFADTIDRFVIGYKAGTGSSAAREAGAALSEQIQGEGTVLLKNEDESGDALLPMSVLDAPQVNVFGWASVDWVIGGSGSGEVKHTGSTDFLAALEEFGIGYNEELTDMYRKFYEHREESQNGGQINVSQPSNQGALYSYNYEFSRLYEPSISDRRYYTESILENAMDYSDTAIVVIGRVSGESNDSPKVQYKRTERGGSVVTDNTRTYLEISTEEEALLEYVGEMYNNVIVLINSTNVMELGFLDTIDGLDACLLVASTGSDGAKAIPQIIYDDLMDAEGNFVSITPSGKTADTFAYDLSTSSTYVDTGSGSSHEANNYYTNGDGLYPADSTTTANNGGSDRYEHVACTDYREGIYLGYRWYETADVMGFWDTNEAKNRWGIQDGYDDVVQFPFGFGLSYTTFSWEIVEITHDDGTTLEGDETVTVDVNVTNTGDYPGQDVVELYYTPEYTANGVEKSAVTLLAFGKTIQVLQPGDNEVVSLEFDVSDMKSYDYTNLSGAVGANGPNDKIGGYVLEDGTYTLTLRTDAHTVADEKMADGNDATIEYEVGSDVTYETDDNSGNSVHNLFTGTNTTDGVAIDGNSDGSASITYLSRGNFTGTFPFERAANRAMTQAIIDRNLYDESDANAWDNDPANQPQAGQSIVAGDTSKGDVVGNMVEDPETGDSVFELNETGMTLGTDYDAPEWEDVLDRISVNEMTELVLHGYTKTAALPSINKPETRDLDGPNQVGSFVGNVGSGSEEDPYKTGFSSIVLAQTWNIELAYSMGLSFGAESVTSGVNGWYGPATNLHRSPFGGRNFEYYSEDTLLSGMMCARTVEGAKNRGVFCYLKHLCLYETEAGRDGMYTWLTEQALRELYVKPFEIAIKDGGATGIMTSYGRIGSVWTGGSEALLTELLRTEWGFQGAFITDYSDHHEFMNGDQMIRAGGDLWMDWYTTVGDGDFRYNTSSDAFRLALRKATKNVVYMWLNALATNADYNERIANGEIDDIAFNTTVPELNFRWYIPVLIVVDVLAVGGCGVWIFFAVRKKDKDAAAAAVPTETDEQP